MKNIFKPICDHPCVIRVNLRQFLFSIMFKLSSTPLENLPLNKGLSHPANGAIVGFEGVVRNHHQGQKVVALEYEAFAKLADKEAKRILMEAKKKFDVTAVQCFHRVGKLKVGDMAVWVGAGAAHRDEAFKACRYTIDEIKKRLPIWKKEYYKNGDSGWVNCKLSGSRNKRELSQITH